MSKPIQMDTGGGSTIASTTSTTFVPFLSGLPALVLNVAEPAGFIVRFIAECRIIEKGALIVRLTVDGNRLPPGEMVLTTNSQYETRVIEGFTTRKLSAGSHAIGIEWRVTGGKGYLRKRCLTAYTVV